VALPAALAENTLGKLQRNFWCGAPEPSLIPPGDDSLQLIQAAGWARQATAIAWETATLLRNNPDYCVDDFLILSPQPQVFLKIARPIFNEYNLPLASGTTSVGEYPGPNHFSQALTTVDSDWQWPEMTVFIRQQYSGELAAEGDRLLIELGERYGALSGNERWHNLINNHSFKIYFLEKGLNLAPFELGIALLESIPRVAGLKVYLESAAKYFNAVVNTMVRNLTADSTNIELQLFNLKAVRQLIQAIAEVLTYADKLQTLTKEISLEEFRNFWFNYIITLEVKARPLSGPTIRVLVPQEARGVKAKTVFITGLEQGVFPRNYVNDWKLSLKDRRELQALGVELETGEQYQTKEKLAFYWAIQTAEEHLYLVYQNQDSSGQPVNPSSYLDEVLQYYPELLGRTKCYPLALEPPQSLVECCSSMEQGSFLAAQLITATSEIPEAKQNNCFQLLENPIYQQLARQIWQEYNQRVALKRVFFQESESKQLVAKLFGVDHTFAITALEDYHSCPYRFFLKHLLNVKPILTPQLLPDNLDLGNLYHQVLQEFAETFRGQALSNEGEQEYRQVLGESFRGFYREWQQNAANDMVKLVLSLQEAQIWGTLQRC
jgi:ATP-dependent helicase/DNAse subunit B